MPLPAKTDSISSPTVCHLPKMSQYRIRRRKMSDTQTDIPHVLEGLFEDRTFSEVLTSVPWSVSSRDLHRGNDPGYESPEPNEDSPDPHRRKSHCPSLRRSKSPVRSPLKARQMSALDLEKLRSQAPPASARSARPASARSPRRFRRAAESVSPRQNRAAQSLSPRSRGGAVERVPSLKAKPKPKPRPKPKPDPKPKHSLRPRSARASSSPSHSKSTPRTSAKHKPQGHPKELVKSHSFTMEPTHQRHRNPNLNHKPIHSHNNNHTQSPTHHPNHNAIFSRNPQAQ